MNTTQMLERPGAARRGRSALTILAAMAAATVATLLPARPAAAEPAEYLPASQIEADVEVHDYLYDSKSQVGDVFLPDCNSVNIDGRYGEDRNVTWTVKSSIGSGSTVHIGDTWKVTASMRSKYWVPWGNNGPDPLTMKLVPDGPVTTGKPTTATYEMGQYQTHHGGPGSVGLKEPSGAWGYSFDTNSNPNGVQLSDGVNAAVEVTMKATGSGYIKLPHLKVSGYDETGLGGWFSCQMQVGFIWKAVNPDLPKGGTDVARSDARYPASTPDDANGGVHAININVLANDDDTNLPGGPGLTSEVRIRDWSAKSIMGGTVSCGDASKKGLPQSAPFSSLSTGPCRYTPPVGFTGTDSFTYSMRQKTKDMYEPVWVHVDVLPNRAPVAPVAQFGAEQNKDHTFSLVNTVLDPDGDTVVCQPKLVKAPAAGGTVKMKSDCTFLWDNTAPTFHGTVSFTYRACDRHDTLTESDLGPHVDRASGYSTGSPSDLSTTQSSRCSDHQASILVNKGLVAPPTAVADADVVDAGYAGDGVGPYSLRLAVLANDYDVNGPKPGSAGWGGKVLVTGFDEATGTATVDGDHIRYTPADGFSGLVKITYAVCEDPAKQAQPYQGLPVCGAGVASVTVRANHAPIAHDDTFELLAGETAGPFDLRDNDWDPNGDPTSCEPGEVAVAPAGLVSSAVVDTACTLIVTAPEGPGGTGTLGYTICDGHLLAQPKYPAVPYGADGRSPGDVAPRCATATVTVQVHPNQTPPRPRDPLPVCADDAAVGQAGQPVTIDVVANDTDVDIDGNNAAVTLAGPLPEDNATSKAGGTVAAVDGKILYTAPADFAGLDGFTYTGRDSSGQFCTGFVSVSVREAVREA